jgi:hypothetical protein
VVTCNVLCLSSLFLGTKVIKRAIATGTVVFPVHQVSATPAPTPTVKKPVEKEKPYLVSTGSKKRSLEN